MIMRKNKLLISILKQNICDTRTETVYFLTQQKIKDWDNFLWSDIRLHICVCYQKN